MLDVSLAGGLQLNTSALAPGVLPAGDEAETFRAAIEHQRAVVFRAWAWPPGVGL